MKNYTKYLPVLVAVLITFFAANIAKAQDDSNYAFVIFETTVTRQGVPTSDKNPEERRFYISNVVEFPETDPSVYRRASKIADEYFTSTVVEPLKAKGILHQYYDDGIRINNNVVYRLDTKAEVEELQKKTLDELKEQSANVFTFVWTRDGNPNGLETSKPTLVYHDPEKPLYGAGEQKPTLPKMVEPAQTQPNAKTPPKKRPRKH